ncbi:acyl-CoA dehydrogenase family protein [Tardiphaga sp. 538_B7_N1_4]|uniref:acyl-CoA dehydrogenase family protein n=1 Tax=Tardiphaga sp. 538_B7_N1_4 TaxID=3240778 RepID=UPI001B8A0DF3|nr:acyl-CoA dehydrogenase family protein [Bradyrhizobium diazoefficiens]MBR0967359.1 acyl-CoA dehydrogenase [Bradyrhizobium diazoefficiens]MBR0976680.1 acyl-CoA dehydrogenase [Bradyrhizobium diazoefficiens]MBR1005325.1 acyl-CoA dehydrogenase [Bradyrhizobium diazoefficiens]MBR1011798.1 acyl-CoA dehydrogenase [Bradyrhizobium diazoefficiens]MBR1049139.1 acyl-CoA dehydrogenase [Bradyrhizobium diazoefficiens]
MSTESGLIIRDVAQAIFSDHANPRTIIQQKGQNWKAPLWEAIEQNGLSLSWIDERLGGSGASLEDGFELVQVAGFFGLAVPLVETMLAGWLLALAELSSPSGSMTVLPVHLHDRILVNPDGTISGTAHDVPFARDCEHFAVLTTDSNGSQIHLVKTADCRIEQKDNLAGDPRDTVMLQKVIPSQSGVVAKNIGPMELRLMGCVIRSVQISGALQRVLALTAQYAGERVAFGRPIGRFQAVQNNIARLAGEAAAANAAAKSAADAVSNTTNWDEEIFLEVAASKIRCGEAAAHVASISHQVHGAIGFTQEHTLHRFSLRALAWRDDFGNEASWSVLLGDKIVRNGAERLWPLLASR